MAKEEYSEELDAIKIITNQVKISVEYSNRVPSYYIHFFVEARRGKGLRVARSEQRELKLEIMEEDYQNLKERLESQDRLKNGRLYAEGVLEFGLLHGKLDTTGTVHFFKDEK